MLYTRLTQIEVSKITKILDSHAVTYEVLADEEMIARQNDEMKYVLNNHGQYRRSNAFYNLILESSEFAKLSVQSVKELEVLNIYPELSEEIFEAESEFVAPMKPTPPKGPVFQIIAIAILIAMAFFWIKDLQKYFT
jgi:hypothetical protein